MAVKKKASPGRTIIAQNRRARYDYEIEETLEAGIVLTGTEVKALRAGHGSLNESYAGTPLKAGKKAPKDETDDEALYLLNAFIPEYAFAHHSNHAPRRPRKLLLKRREIERLFGAISRKGMTVVPLSMYFNSRGLVKVSLGLAKGKRQVEKRATEKERDWKRQKERLMKGSKE